jgi:hypothetical protein
MLNKSLCVCEGVAVKGQGKVKGARSSLALAGPHQLLRVAAEGEEVYIAASPSSGKAQHTHAAAKGWQQLRPADGRSCCSS